MFIFKRDNMFFTSMRVDGKIYWIDRFSKEGL